VGQTDAGSEGGCDPSPAWRLVQLGNGPNVPQPRRPYRAERRRGCVHTRLSALTVLVDREGRIAISHAGVVDPLVFEADINALLAILDAYAFIGTDPGDL